MPLAENNLLTVEPDASDEPAFHIYQYYNPTSVCMPSWMGNTAATHNILIFEYYLLEGNRKYLMIILFSSRLSSLDHFTMHAKTHIL